MLVWPKTHLEHESFYLVNHELSASFTWQEFTGEKCIQILQSHLVCIVFLILPPMMAQGGAGYTDNDRSQIQNYCCDSFLKTCSQSQGTAGHNQWLKNSSPLSSCQWGPALCSELYMHHLAHSYSSLGPYDDAHLTDEGWETEMKRFTHW